LIVALEPDMFRRSPGIESAPTGAHQPFTSRRRSYGDLLADVDADGDEDEASDGEVLADDDADDDDDAYVRTDGEAVAVGTVDVRTDGEAIAVGDWYVPVNDGALAEEDTRWAADGLAGTPGDVCPGDVESAGADVCAVGWSITGAGDCPVKEVRATAVAPDTTRSTPMTHASTIGRERRRRGRLCRFARAAELAAVVRVGPGYGATPGAVSAGPDPAEAGPDGADAEPDGVARTNVRVNESGSQSPPG
jgi:hypothetical protein